MANNSNNKQVEPYSIGAAIGIIVLLCALDTVGCIVSIIGAYIFMKKGHQGLALALALINFVSPDALPVVDEIFGVVTIVIPYFKNRSEGKSVTESVKASVDSSKQYKNSKVQAIQKSEQVVNKINASVNQQVNYSNDNYEDNDYEDDDGDYYEKG